VAQLLRDNASDARVTDDVLALAAAYDDDAIEASAAAMREALAEDMAMLSKAFGEPSSGESWWSETRTQVLRYRGYVAAAVVILAVIVFVHPAPRPLAIGDSGDTSLIPTSDSQRAAASSPSLLPPASDAFSDPFDFVVPAPTSDNAFAVTPEPFDATPERYAPAPTTLRVASSGYSSTFAGTPADQAPPANGLPAESIGGQVTKYSFVRLVGSGAGLNESAARRQLCHITTANWKATRGAAPGDAPKYDATCIEGHVASGVWIFNFSAVTNPVDPNGWAVVPITDGNATFRVTFAPSAA
jgi:hypothetical protein